MKKQFTITQPGRYVRRDGKTITLRQIGEAGFRWKDARSNCTYPDDGSFWGDLDRFEDQWDIVATCKVVAKKAVKKSKAKTKRKS